MPRLTGKTEKLEGNQVEIEYIFEEEKQHISDLIILVEELGRPLELWQRQAYLLRHVHDGIERLLERTSPLKK